MRGESCMALRRVPLWGTAGGSLAALGCAVLCCAVRGVCDVSPCHTAAIRRPYGGQRVARGWPDGVRRRGPLLEPLNNAAA